MAEPDRRTASPAAAGSALNGWAPTSFGLKPNRINRFRFFTTALLKSAGQLAARPAARTVFLVAGVGAGAQLLQVAAVGQQIG